MSEYTIAEVIDLGDGNLQYIVEYEREGFGVQRPTFDIPADTSVQDAIDYMKPLIEAERAINESVDPPPETPAENPAVGTKF